MQVLCFTSCSSLHRSVGRRLRLSSTLSSGYSRRLCNEQLLVQAAAVAANDNDADDGDADTSDDMHSQPASCQCRRFTKKVDGGNGWVVRMYCWPTDAAAAAAEC